jgi:hypothetical protein
LLDIRKRREEKIKLELAAQKQEILKNQENLNSLPWRTEKFTGR